MLSVEVEAKNTHSSNKSPSRKTTAAEQKPLPASTPESWSLCVHIEVFDLHPLQMTRILHGLD